MIFPFSNLRQVIGTIAFVFLLLIVLWVSAWIIGALQFRQVIDGWIENGRAAGYKITYDKERMSGFPHRIVLRFKNLAWKNTDQIEFHASDIDIIASPWQWQKFDADFRNHGEISAPVEGGGKLVLAGEEGHAYVELNEQGLWTFTEISLQKAKLGVAPLYIFEADRLEATAERPAEAPKDSKDPGLTLQGEAENLVMPSAMSSPFGNIMAKVVTDMRVMGPVPDFRKKESVAAWTTDFGVVEFSKLQMDWGAMKLTAKGTLGFDDDLQPEGAFAGAIGDHQAVLKALMEYGFIAKRQEAMLNSALSLFAKPSDMEDAEGIELPITIQLGGLFFGPVTIFRFPEIIWPESTPAPQ